LWILRMKHSFEILSAGHFHLSTSFTPNNPLLFGLYFDRHNMQVDWKVLTENPIEQVVNNLVLVINLDAHSKQLLLESATVTERLKLFTKLLEEKADPTLIMPQHSGVLN
ncbi:MAG: hypothetical protein JAY74_17510, partial [Candidatus Thiodiazotropha taylori]|nr:hypothetical protein [Candidatus Thiodiazotropha taylori]